MDIQIARRKEEIMRRQDQIKREIKVHTEAVFEMSREQLIRNNEMVDMLNKDLETLRLEFQLEEVGIHPETIVENLDQKRETCCCKVCPVNLPEMEAAPCTYDSLIEYFKVSTPQDYISKREWLARRVNNLTYCNCKCFHHLGYAMNFWTSDYNQEKVGVAIQVICSLVAIPCLFLFCLSCAPGTWVYGCCQGCLNKTYQRQSRTKRILDLYNSYDLILQE